MVAKLVGKNTNPIWLVGLVWTACGHAPPPCPASAPLPVIVRAADQLNTDDNGQALPTTIRLYQLKDVGRLATATLEQMLENDRAVLGEDLLSVREITLYPGEAAKPVLDRREGAAFLALVAFFRHPTGSNWRTAGKLPPPDPSSCHEPTEHVRPAFRFALVGNQINSR